MKMKCKKIHIDYLINDTDVIPSDNVDIRSVPLDFCANFRDARGGDDSTTRRRTRSKQSDARVTMFSHCDVKSHCRKRNKV
jgi:hypothetical protein